MDADKAGSKHNVQKHNTEMETGREGLGGKQRKGVAVGGVGVRERERERESVCLNRKREGERREC